MKILIIGASGQLGKSLQTSLKSNAITLERNPRLLIHEEVNHLMEEIYSLQISGIVNCAAWTDVDSAERNETHATEANTLLPAKLAKVAMNLKIPFYQISTDYVFQALIINLGV